MTENEKNKLIVKSHRVYYFATVQEVPVLDLSLSHELSSVTELYN